MKRLGLLFAAGAAAFALAGQAAAAIVTVTAQGFTDITGGQFTNLPFTAVLKFDTSLGRTRSGPGFYTTYGGSAYIGAPQSPALSAAITINGATVSIDPTFMGVLDANSSTLGHSEIQVSAESNSGADYIALWLQAAPGVLPAVIDQSFSLDTTGAGYGGQSAFKYGRVSGVLHLTSLTETVSGVPEPATWLMLLLGIGGLGLALRARRSAVASPATASA